MKQFYYFRHGPSLYIIILYISSHLVVYAIFFWSNPTFNYLFKYIIDTKIGIKSKTDYKDLKDLDLEIISNDILLPSPHSAKDPISEDKTNMVEIDIIQSSPSINPVAMTIDQRFLISAAD